MSVSRKTGGIDEKIVRSDDGEMKAGMPMKSEMKAKMMEKMKEKMADKAPDKKSPDLPAKGQAEKSQPNTDAHQH